MKPVSWDKQLGLASPLETAASQSGKIKSPSNKEAGLDVSHHALVSREGRGENFFLDILFYRMSAIACFQGTAFLNNLYFWADSYFLRNSTTFASTAAAPESAIM